MKGALVVLQAQRMRHIDFYFRLYHIFPHYPIKGRIFGKKIIEHIFCGLILAITLYEAFLVLRKINVDMTITEHCFQSRVTYFLYFNQIEISRQTFEKYSNIKI